MSRRSLWFSAAVALLALSLSSGCMCLNQNFQRDLPPPEPVLEGPDEVMCDYWSDRLYDFTDLFRLQWGVPRDFKAFGAKVKITSLAEAGFVYFLGKKAGMERRAIGVIRQDKCEGGITPVYFTGVTEAAECGNYFLVPNTRWQQIRDRRIVRRGLFWSDGTLHPVALGFEIELFCFGGPDVQFYFCELGDFFAGWFGLDPRGDDLCHLGQTEVDNAFFHAAEMDP